MTSAKEDLEKLKEKYLNDPDNEAFELFTRGCLRIGFDAARNDEFGNSWEYAHTSYSGNTKWEYSSAADFLESLEEGK